jgi:hypothetical protein
MEARREMTQPKTVPTPRLTTVTPRAQPNVEVGVSNYLPFATPYRDAWEILRDDDITVTQLAAMRRTDGQARALYRLITLPIRAALKGATFIPESNIDGGEEEAKFVEQMFTLPPDGGGMAIPFHRVIAQLLMAVFEGFSAFEMVYWVPTSGPLAGKWTLQKLAHRPAETVTFLLDDKGNYAGLRQRVMFQGRYIDVPIPGAHSFYWAANEEERPFYGRSFFESAFYHWDKKFKLYVIAHIAAQRAAVGTRVGKLPKNPKRDEKLEFSKALADLGVAQYMTIPEDYGVESLREGGTYDFLALINHHNNQMSKSILAPFFDDQQGSGGDTTLVDFGRQSDALFLLMLQTIMGEIEEVINTRVIPRFIDWNFGTGKYPSFQFGSLSQEQRSAILAMFQILAVAGQALTISPEFVHELEKQVAEDVGLEIDWESVEARQAAEAAAAAAGAQPGTEPGAEPGGEEPAAEPGTAPGAPPASGINVPAHTVPEGFQLSQPDTAELIRLVAAMDDDERAALTRGVPRDGGPKFIRTPAGAQVYGAPIGTPITRDMAQRTGHHGVKGKVFGAGVQDPNGPSRRGHQVLGGGPGAAANLGGVATKPVLNSTPSRTFTNPAAPGAVLMLFPDGTVAIRDRFGRSSPRQHFDIQAFIHLGWQISPTNPATGAPKTGFGGPGKATQPSASPGGGASPKPPR